MPLNMSDMHITVNTPSKYMKYDVKIITYYLNMYTNR